jgi:hypothetical protein
VPKDEGYTIAMEGKLGLEIEFSKFTPDYKANEPIFWGRL